MAQEVKAAAGGPPQSALHLYEATPPSGNDRLQLSNQDVCSILNLLVTKSPSLNVFTHFPPSVAGEHKELAQLEAEASDDPRQPQVAHPLIVELFSREGAEVKLPASGHTVSNADILSRASAYLTSHEHCSRVAAGHYANVFLCKFHNTENGVLVRQFHDQERLQRVRAALDATRASTFPVKGVHLCSLEKGYAILQAPEQQSELTWVSQWLCLAAHGFLHLDLKPANLYRHAFVDFDNALFQLAGKPEWTTSDAAFYKQKAAVIADIERVLQMVGSKTNFFISGEYAHLSVISLHPLDVDRLAELLKHPLQAQWMESFEEVRSRLVTLCDVQFPTSVDQSPLKIPFYLDSAKKQAAESDAIWRKISGDSGGCAIV